LAVVLVAVLAWVTAPALSLEPYAPKVTEFEASPSVPPATARAASRGGGRPVTLPIVRAPKRFDLVGLTWRDRGLVEAQLRVRRDGGRWSRWLDPGHGENGERGSGPLLTGGTDEVQVRLDRVPRGLKLRFVNATGTADRGSRIVTSIRRAANTAVIAALGPPAIAARRQASGAPPMVAREQWDPGGQCKPRSSPGYGEVKAALVHHTVTSNLYVADDGPSMVLAICRYHRNGNGWTDIGYNFLVDRYGTIYEGRAGGIDRAVVGAQAQGFNASTTGISNLGTFTSGGQTTVALQANARLIAWKLGIHGVPLSGEASIRSQGGRLSRYPSGAVARIPTVSGHRDVGSTECPGTSLYAQLPELRRLVLQAPAGIPVAPGPTTPIPAGAISLEAPARTVTFGAGAQVGGRVTTNDGDPLVGAEVRVQVRTASRWQTLARATSGEDGGWLTSLPTQRSRTIRALAYVQGQRAATSSELKIAVQALVEARAAKRVVIRRPLTVRGRVRPAKGRLTLAIARQGRDGRYRTADTIRIRPRKGAYRLTIRVRRPALYRLRVSFAGDATNTTSRSADVIFRAIRPRAASGGAQPRTR
jgi:uncharacterized protein with LGFP repeats